MPNKVLKTMLSYKEYKKAYIERYPDYSPCSGEDDKKIARAYADYVEQQEITILKKENEELKRQNQILRGMVMNFERKAHPHRMIHFRPKGV